MGLVLIASYPKSGSTWLRLALQDLQRPGEPLDINDTDGRAYNPTRRWLVDATLGVESSDLTEAEVLCALPRMYEVIAGEPGAPRVVKVHDAWIHTPTGEPLFPRAAISAVLYLVRDPRDVAVSYAHHMGCSMEAAIDHMADPNATNSPARDVVRNLLPQRVLTWSRHVESWLDAKEVPLSLVRYEEMIADMKGVLTRLAYLIDGDMNPGSIDRTVETVRFSRLRAAEDASGFIERPRRAFRFFRRGVAGAWRDELTATQAHRVVRDHGDVMRRLGYL
jgi:hypothetical protein